MVFLHGGTGGNGGSSSAAAGAGGSPPPREVHARRDAVLDSWRLVSARRSDSPPRRSGSAGRDCSPSRHSKSRQRSRSPTGGRNRSGRAVPLPGDREGPQTPEAGRRAIRPRRRSRVSHHPVASPRTAPLAPSKRRSCDGGCVAGREAASLRLFPVGRHLPLTDDRPLQDPV
ncbi:hypothetical protein PVAP13_8KG258522 [Panicum virgatum]|uniref:Uncharacterized protein n=1 Tax=Panicum virgatum TaxID=38727 RepID=A0A8T0PXI3_PANVG|nr:hypothetical protein PVAP13_8KG258522 [Panicum virgatum]